MTTRNLTIEMKDSKNNKITRKISYANADASDAILYNFAIKLVGLTSNTLLSVSKDDSTIITGE